MSRVALVTGAARGIGAAVVDRLCGDGWQVVALDVCADLPGVPYPLAAREQLTGLAARWPGAVLEVVADVRDAGALRAAAALAEEQFGGLDAAVAAAAVLLGGRPLWQTEEPEWDLLLGVGVLGVANLAAAAVPAMLRRPAPRSGRFVALSSAAGHRGLERLGAYCAAKHAVLGLVRGLAADLRGTGVTATAVAPGSTRGAMLAASAELYGLASQEEFARYHLLERLLDPAEVAAAVGWLCGPDSTAVTGSVLHADGGFSG